MAVDIQKLMLIAGGGDCVALQQQCAGRNAGIRVGCIDADFPAGTSWRRFACDNLSPRYNQGAVNAL